MIHRGAWVVGAVLVTLTGCTTGGTPTPTPTTSAPATTAAPATTTQAPPATTTAVTTAAPPVTTPATTPDALAFFRGQQAPCDQHAHQVGNAPVEPDRFSGAKVVRDLGNGATQIEDGRGTKLVVVPARGTVLPASGNPADVMPAPYGFSCSEKVFLGASND